MLHDGEQIGPYQVTEQHGSGGMATVYRAYHAKLDRYVAIKMLHQIFLQDQAFQARFEREAQIIARLEHPNIIPIYDFSEYENQPYLVMKYVEGPTLKDILQTEKVLPLDVIRRVLRPLADALTYAHEQNVLHRDIKPSNIIIDATGTPYLTDFGLARIAQAGESTISHDMLLGTPQYISPEQAKGGVELDARTDVYSFGVVLYELVVGRVPFSGDTPYAIIHDQIYSPLPPPRQVNPNVPESVERVLNRALAKKPADRYPTVKALFDDFEAAIDAEGEVDLGSDRADVAATSLAALRRERGEAASDQGGSDLIPTPISDSQAPDAVVDPMEEARQRVEGVREGVDQVLDSVIGKDRSEKLDNTIDWIQNKVLEKIEEGFESGKIQVSQDEKKPGSWNFEWDDDDDDKDEGGISEADIRRRVEKRFEHKRDLGVHFSAFVGVNALLWSIWACTSGLSGFPWPMIVSLAWGSGMVAHMIETYFKTGRRADLREAAIVEALTETHGPDWRNTLSNRQYKKARKEALKTIDSQMEFLQHLGVFACINVMLWVIFLASGASGFPWPVIVMLGWGIGLFAHIGEYRSKSRRAVSKRREAIEREVARQLEISRGAPVVEEKAKRKRGRRSRQERGVRLTDDGELTDSYAESWEDDAKRKRQ